MEPIAQVDQQHPHNAKSVITVHQKQESITNAQQLFTALLPVLTNT